MLNALILKAIELINPKTFYPANALTNQATSYDFINHVSRRIEDFKGNNLVIACVKNGCSHSHLHDAQNFYSIDIKREADLSAPINVQIPEHIIPNKRFTFILFEGIPGDVIFDPCSHALKNASSKLTDDGVVFLTSGHGHLCSDSHALKDFTNNLKDSGFKYGINLIELLFPDASLGDKVTNGIILLLSNNSSIVKLGQFPAILMEKLKNISLRKGDLRSITLPEHPISDNGAIQLQSLSDLEKSIYFNYSSYQASQGYSHLSVAAKSPMQPMIDLCKNVLFGYFTPMMGTRKRNLNQTEPLESQNKRFKKN